MRERLQLAHIGFPGIRRGQKGKTRNIAARGGRACREQRAESQPDKRDFADAGLAAQEIDRRPNIGYPGRNPVGIFAAARGIGRAVIIEAQNRQPGPGDRAGEVVHRSPATKFLVAEGAAKDDTAPAWHRVKPADAIVKRDRKWNDDGARKQLVQFFEAWGATDPATIEGRKRLSSILFS